MKREMSKEAKEALEKALNSQKDWEATCRKCGQKLTGSLKELKEHSCG